ncbi:CDP-diacylglycerol--glycerol-3-phosphate 3-phosphatidyltransferase [Actinoplanes siamensis]|uniref:CDP-diacylglycerol--glycerol-3-phosphate 3-phosphatidyltransferase n=1 Tax=Actinoplanes siamensis TaxID=1223317 RepID=A0A919K8C0_9ACTN|nr:CDP-diacylglycerol--glycerol-3-phosphate 3-phosphatidyltransferase [Actinoplanes siamensis]GIF02842.1 CDP-diacylglycerol--glycerol-3-phosphate 3-phosphatidyltransferase [Actinoplanes siamensis]
MTDEPVPVAAPRVVSLYNAANALTVVRLVLVPVFLAMVVTSRMTDHDWRVGACLAFCVASATDFVDGWIARRWQLVTSFGKIADPIADKALTGTALVLLSAYGALPWWVTWAILIREWGVTGLRFWVIRYGVIPASRGGKLKTGLQTLAIAWYLWPVPHPFDAVGYWVMGAALIVTLVTGFDYLVQALRLRRS